MRIGDIVDEESGREAVVVASEFELVDVSTLDADMIEVVISKKMIMPEDKVILQFMRVIIGKE